MDELLKVFSTREVSIIIWFIIIMISLSLKKQVRVSFYSVIKAFFKRKILSVFVIYLIYFLLVIYFLNYSVLWDLSLIKDSTIWFFFSATVLLFRSIEIDKNYDFLVLLFKDFKLVLFIEFLLNFYTFKLWQEFIIIPFISLLGIMLHVSEMDFDNKDNKAVSSCLSKVLSFFGFVLFLYVFYKTITEYQKVLTFQNYKALMLPIVLAITNIPFFYLLALWSAYENIFVRLRFFYSSKEIKKIKRVLFFYCKFNLQRVRKANRKISFNTSVDDLIKTLNN